MSVRESSVCALARVWRICVRAHLIDRDDLHVRTNHVLRVHGDVVTNLELTFPVLVREFGPILTILFVRVGGVVVARSSGGGVFLQPLLGRHDVTESHLECFALL